MNKKQTAKPQPANASPQGKAQLALQPSVNAAVVMESYQSNVHGKDVDINELVEGLRATFVQVKDGNLSSLEAMLIGQATALQSIFTRAC